MGVIAENPGDAVYGTIAIGALLAAESTKHETYAETVAAVAVTMFLYYLAHSYAELAGRRLRGRVELTASRALATMLHELPILIGASVPLLVVLIWWMSGGSLAGAVSAAVWTAAAMLILIEVVSGLRAGLSGRNLLLQTLVGAGFGLLLVSLKIILH